MIGEKKFCFFVFQKKRRSFYYIRNAYKNTGTNKLRNIYGSCPNFALRISGLKRIS